MSSRLLEWPYWVLLAVVALGIVAWWAAHGFWGFRRFADLSASQRLVKPFTLSTSERARLLGVAENSGEIHEGFLAGAERSRTESLTVGALALAAWSALLAVSEMPVDGAPVRLLLVGSILLIAGPAVTPTLGRYAGYLLLEGMLLLGYGAVVLALASLVPEVFVGRWVPTVQVVMLGAVLVASLSHLSVAAQLSRRLFMVSERIGDSTDEPDG